MPEQLRSLTYIVLLALIAFFFAKKITASVVSEQQFNRWRNTWVALTFIVFLASNFWVYAILSALLLWFVGKKEQNAFALFFVLLFAIPRISDKISGLGVVNFLFEVDYVTILSLTLLLPAYLSLRANRDTEPFLSLWPDRLLLAYMILVVALLMRDTTATDAMRMVIRNFTDIFLPYYVASRGIKTLQQFKEVLAAFVIAAMVAAMLAIFEYSRFWLLYANLESYLGTTWEMGNYLGRGDSLRALASLGQPIVLGFVMMLALGFYLSISKLVKSRSLRCLGWVLLSVGLYVPLSRGPWVGAALLIIVFLLLSPNRFKNLLILAIASIFSFVLLNIVPAGQKIINLLPFIGNTEAENVDYRVRLIDAAYTVFQRYPLFGSVKFNDELAGLGMTQGEGIVDIVNQYLWIVLERGLVGLMLFVGFFTIVIFQLAMHLKQAEKEDTDTFSPLVGRSLLACLIATMVTITTVSGILVLPVVYWALGGLGVGYYQMIEQLAVKKHEQEFKSYRLAFDVMPALPASKMVFSALTKHKVVVDNKPIPRIKFNVNRNTSENNIRKMIATMSKEVKPRKYPKPELDNLYIQARKIRPNPAGYFEKTLQLPPRAKVQSNNETVSVAAKIRVLNGSNAGKELDLTKVITKLGKSNVQVAIIAKRETGYYLKHLEGQIYPIINNLLIGESAQLLNDQDVIEILGVKMQFYKNGKPSNSKN